MGSFRERHFRDGLGPGTCWMCWENELRLFGRLPFYRSAPSNGRLCGCWLFTVQHLGTGGWVGLHGHADGSGNVIVVTDAGQQHLGCGGQTRSVLLGRFPFGRSLSGHGRLRCGCRSTVEHPGSCGCALLSRAESRNMLTAPCSEPRGCFGGCRSHRSTTRAR